MRFEGSVGGYIGDAVAGHEQNLHIGATRGETGGDLLAVHPGQGEVSQKQMNDGWILLRKTNGSGTVLGHQNRVPFRTEDLLDQSAQSGLVLYHQDGPFSGRYSILAIHGPEPR